MHNINERMLSLAFTGFHSHGDDELTMKWCRSRIMRLNACSMLDVWMSHVESLKKQNHTSRENDSCTNCPCRLSSEAVVSYLAASLSPLWWDNQAEFVPTCLASRVPFRISLLVTSHPSSIISMNSNTCSNGGNGIGAQGNGSTGHASNVSTNGTGLQLNPAAQYKKDASLVDIFGPHVQPGRVLLDEIIRCYKARKYCFLNVFKLNFKYKYYFLINWLSIITQL